MDLKGVVEIEQVLKPARGNKVGVGSPVVPGAEGFYTLRVAWKNMAFGYSTRNCHFQQ